MSGIYSDEFENNFNSRMSPANIKATAKKFIEFEKEHGATYKFGMFAKALLRAEEGLSLEGSGLASRMRSFASW